MNKLKQVKIYKYLFLIAVIFISILLWIFFKPIRVLEPKIVGVVSISSNVYIDDISHSNEAFQLYQESLNSVNTSVGQIEKNPYMIFCSTDVCAQSFGLGKRAGMTVGSSGIVISPRGWKSYYIRHEMIHHLQIEKMGLIKFLMAPEWFIEGMAYSLSGDPRIKLSDRFEKDRIRFNNWYLQIDKQSLWNTIPR